MNHCEPLHSKLLKVRNCKCYYLIGGREPKAEHFCLMCCCWRAIELDQKRSDVHCADLYRLGFFPSRSGTDSRCILVTIRRLPSQKSLRPWETA